MEETVISYEFSNEIKWNFFHNVRFFLGAKII